MNRDASRCLSRVTLLLFLGAPKHSSGPTLKYDREADL